MAKQFVEYLKGKGLYTPQPGSLAEFLETQKVKKTETKPKKLWTYHYPNYETGMPVAVQAYSQTEARQKASAMGLPTTEVLPDWRGPAYKEKRLGEIGEQVGTVGERVKELKTQLGGMAGEEVGADTEELTMALAAKTGEEVTTTGLTDFSKIWEDEYTKAGLEDIKTKISGIDADITTRKEQRDKLLLDEMGKPIPQWMITGRKKLEIDAATADINRLIDQRNSLATQYNTGITEVTRKVGYAIDYQKELARQLREGAEAPDVIGSADTGYYVWDADKGEYVQIIPPTPKEGGRAKGLQVIKNIMGEPIGYFDPETGETTYYGEEGAPGAPTGAGAPGAGMGGIQWFSESDIRTVVNEQLDQNIPVETIKSKFANIRASDTSKSVNEIIDEEAQRRAGGGGWTLGRLFPWRTAEEKAAGVSGWRALLPW
jgi:hypothetical protein